MSQQLSLQISATPLRKSAIAMAIIAQSYGITPVSYGSTPVSDEFVPQTYGLRAQSSNIPTQSTRNHLSNISETSSPETRPLETRVHQTNSSESIRFQLESKPAYEALIEFASQSNLTVVLPYSVVKDVQANGIYGNYTASRAIELLLQGTKLEASINSDNQIVVKEKPQIPQPPISLVTRVVDFFQSDTQSVITVEPEKALRPYEHILVRGYRASNRESMSVKRGSDFVVDNIQSIEMGKFPDQNLAESLQRIAGVSIDRAEGEGQFVTVRGFGPEFNTVLLNGRQMASDNLGREFSFDTLASELVSGVSVYKTHSAAVQSGGIGATINIETARPLSIPNFQFVGTYKQLYDQNSKDYSPQYSALISNSYQNNTFGLLLAVNEQQRYARIDEAQIDGWLVNTEIPAEQLVNSADNVFVPRNYDQRVRFDKRTRSGKTLVLQYRPDDQLEVVADVLHAELDIETNATSLGHWFTSSNLDDVITDDNGTVVEFQQNVGHATDFHARTFDRPSEFFASGLNFIWRADNAFSWETDFSYSRATIDDDNGANNALSLIGYLNRSAFDHSNNEILPHIFGFQSASDNIINAMGENAGVSHYLDPANGRPHVMLRRGWNIEDKVKQFRLDGRWDNDSSGHGNAYPNKTGMEIEGLSHIEFGIQHTKQTKNNIRIDNEANARHCVFCGYFELPDIPDNFQTRFDAGSDFLDSVSGHQFIPNQWLRHDGEQLFSFLEQSGDVDLSAVRRGNSFEVSESVFSSYIDVATIYEINDMTLTNLLGLRYESTKVEVQGFSEQLLRLDILDQTELGPVTDELRSVSFSNNYRNWLPSINTKLELSEHWIARIAWSKSLTRPTMSRLSPGVTLNTTRQGGDLRASSGEPSLRPFESQNLDIFLDFYYQDNSYISVGYFSKDVKNFIVTESTKTVFNNVTDPSTGSNSLAPDPQDQAAVFDLVKPRNSEKAKVNGLEFSISHQFSGSGYGLIANTTMVDSNAELDQMDLENRFALTGLSDSKNLVLFYEKDKLQWRLAWNHRNGFLQSLVQSQSSEPTFVAPYKQLDFTASYDINANISIFFEGINLTNEVVRKHGRYDNQLLLIQDTGTRYSIGIKARL